MPITPEILRFAAVVLFAAMAPDGLTAFAQGIGVYKDAQVANFVAADRMDGDHAPVTLSFWSGPHGKVIDYDPGDGSGSVRLHRIGRTADKQGLRVRAPGGSTWAMTPSNGLLLLDDNLGQRPRVFLWQYQGPVDGRGTACRQCVGEKEALRFVYEQFVLGAP